MKDSFTIKQSAERRSNAKKKKNPRQIIRMRERKKEMERENKRSVHV